MSTKIGEVCRQALKKIIPSSYEKEKIQSLAEEVRSRVSSEVDKIMSDVQVIVGGSVAKDTWLKNEADVDVFMLFPPNLSKEKLGEVGLRAAKKALKDWSQRERYAEHPYLEAEMNGIRANVVPCYKAEQGKWLSAADRSPFHTDYVKAKFHHRNLSDEVRLLKRFMKGVGVYGAEVRVGGFSGYLCELLILNYQSFHHTLEAASAWKIGTVIDIENLHERRFDEARRFFDAPLIVVDPVDLNRNVATAVSSERLGEFIMASRSFLTEPSLSFLYPDDAIPLSASMLKKRLSQIGFDLIFLVFKGEEAVPDVLWGQLYKSLRAIKKLLIHNDFNVLKVSAWSDEKKKNILVFALESHLLSASKQHIGPPIDSKGAVRFLTKHVGADSTVIGPWIEDNRWIVCIQRKYTNVASLLQDKLKGGGRDAGVAKKFAEGIKDSIEILVNEEVLGIYSADEDFALFLSDFLQGKPKWLG